MILESSSGSWPLAGVIEGVGKVMEGLAKPMPSKHGAKQ
jgi:hypothetical protein